ncbi:nickel-dependent lactate racemase [Lactiplantibacillus daowaiensis]|uniref:Nickel-dependent lactate racemase n=1 Tax=Lactiplantibacillus daowaiensis TaxID=2559918 RepID=A0ABW1RW10_9LACO|nr:nickel-dependent lactate racemase [Lactiplantibacillus daowaiensis]
MNINVPYGKSDQFKITVPDQQLVGVFNPNPVDAVDENMAIDQALKSPYFDESFDEFMATDEQVVFIVNDGTRPTPTAKILQHIYPKIKDKNIYFIVATGVHREPTQEEYNFIFGKDIYADLVQKHRIHCHDCHNDPMTYLGESQNGTPMYLNKIVAEAHKVVPISSIEPHYFAGYTGGRKSFLPGVASYDTISKNHYLALQDSARALKLDGNPVHEDMMDAMKVLSGINIFAIEMVLDSHHDIYAVTAGDLTKSFYAGIDKAKEVYGVMIPKKADIVISTAPYPMDVDLYQSQKALDNGKLALNQDGILILVAKCRTGIGPKPFYDLLSSEKEPAAVLDKIHHSWKLGYHKAAKMAQIDTWAQTWAVSDLTDEEMRNVHFKPYHDLKVALADALAEKGSDASVIVLPAGSMTVPEVQA